MFSQKNSLNIKYNVDITNLETSLSKYISYNFGEDKTLNLKDELFHLKNEYKGQDEIVKNYILYTLLLQNENNIKESINTNNVLIKNKELPQFLKNIYQFTTINDTVFNELNKKISQGSSIENERHKNIHAAKNIEKVQDDEALKYLTKADTIKDGNAILIDVSAVVRNTDRMIKDKIAVSAALDTLYYAFAIFSAVLRGINLIVLIAECIIHKKKLTLTKNDYFDLGSFIILFGLAVAVIPLVATLAGTIIGLISATILVVRNVKEWVSYVKRYREIRAELQENELQQKNLQEFKNSIQELINLKKQIEIWQKIKDFIQNQKIVEINKKIATIDSHFIPPTRISELIADDIAITKEDLQQIGISDIKKIKDINIENEIQKLKENYQKKIESKPFIQQVQNYNQIYKTNILLEEPLDLNQISHDLTREQHQLAENNKALQTEKKQNYHGVDIAVRVLTSAALVGGIILSAIAFTTLSVGTAGIVFAVASMVFAAAFFGRKLYNYCKNKKNNEKAAAQTNDQNTALETQSNDINLEPAPKSSVKNTKEIQQALNHSLYNPALVNPSIVTKTEIKHSNLISLPNTKENQTGKEEKKEEEIVQKYEVAHAPELQINNKSKNSLSQQINLSRQTTPSFSRMN